MTDHKELNIPRRALPYVVLQRLETQQLGANIHYTPFGKLAYAAYEHVPFAKTLFYYYSTRLEPFLRSASIREAYSRTMQREFATIEPHLQPEARRIAGIGPGVAGLEILISKYYRERYDVVPEIILIDKSQVDEVYYGFHETAAAYNSLDVAREGLAINGHPDDKIRTLDADGITIEEVGKVDLITSLIAWGFHFPVTTYLPLALQALNPGGQLIIDVRKDTGGFEELESAFGQLTILHDDPKFQRILATKS